MSACVRACACVSSTRKREFAHARELEICKRKELAQCSASALDLVRMVVCWWRVPTELHVRVRMTLIDVRPNSELWSDSNDSQTPSNASVASDADAEETVYEDHTNIVRVLQVILQLRELYTTHHSTLETCPLLRFLDVEEDLEAENIVH